MKESGEGEKGRLDISDGGLGGDGNRRVKGAWMGGRSLSTSPVPMTSLPPLSTVGGHRRRDPGMETVARAEKNVSGVSGTSGETRGTA